MIWNHVFKYGQPGLEISLDSHEQPGLEISEVHIFMWTAWFGIKLGFFLFLEEPGLEICSFFHKQPGFETVQVPLL